MPTVAFGDNFLSFDLDPGDSLTEREPGDSGLIWNTRRFAEILAASRFESMIGGQKPLVIVNDAFRPTPTGAVLAQIKNLYPDFAADFIIACGNHPAPNQDDMATIFKGFAVPESSKVFVHDSRNIESMTEIGKNDDFPVYINSAVFDYHALIVIGSVEPHYFAGFTGGRKSIVPGLCDIDTTRRNHALAVSTEARPLRLTGNPVAEHLARLLSQIELPPIFSFQIVAGRDRQVLDCFVGDMTSSFEQAVDLATQVYGFKPEHQYDLVVAEMTAPLDRNLYQMQKGIENCAAAVKNDGTLLVISPCNEGIGNDEFFQLAGRLHNEEMVVSYADMDNPPLGIHKLSRVVRLQDRISVKAITKIKHEILEQVFIEPAVAIDSEIQKLKSDERRQIDILLVRDAGLLAVTSD